MKSQLRFLPVVLLTCVVGCAKWQDYTAPDGSFRCRLPGKVKTESKSEPMPGGGTLNITSHTATAGRTEYGVLTFDLPPGTPFNQEAGAAGAARAVGGTVTSKTPCAVEGVTGLEFEFTVTTPRVAKGACRLFVRNNRAYQIVVIGPLITSSTKDVQDLWNSFKLLKK